MSQRSYGLLIVILLLVAAVVWINLPNNPGIHLGSFNNTLETRLGLDLKGGLQVLLEVDLPADKQVDAQSLQDARQILENRANGLGVSEVLFQIAGNRRIVGELPGLTDTEQVIKVLKQVGHLEFVDMGSDPLPEGTVIKTDVNQSATGAPAAGGTANPTGGAPTGTAPTGAA